MKDAAGKGLVEKEQLAANDEDVTWVDWLMLALAVVSLALVLIERTFHDFLVTHPRVDAWLIRTDLIICGVFFVEFVGRLSKANDKWMYAKSRWYDILGMIPVSHPVVRGFRMLRILRVLVITSRFVRATNRTFGEMTVEVVFRRFQATVVEVIGDAILLRSLDTVEPHFAQARLAASIGDALETRRSDLQRLVKGAMRRVPGGSAVLRFKYGRQAVEAAENAAIETVVHVLQSDELNEVVQQATVNVFDELRRQVRARDPEQSGLEVVAEQP